MCFFLSKTLAIQAGEGLWAAMWRWRLKIRLRGGGGREAEYIVESWFSNQDKTNEVGGDQDIEDVDKGGNLGGFAAGSSTLRGPWKER